MNHLLAGSVGGFVATVPMSAVMLLGQRVFPGHARKPLPPEEITEEVVERTPGARAVGPKGLRVATLVSHFGFGAAAGAAFGPLSRRLPGPPIVKGLGYGLLVWTVAYSGWLPSLGLQPPPERQPAGRNLAMIAAHLVWGAVLGKTWDRARLG